MNPPRSTARNALSASLQTAVTTAAGLFYFGYLMRTLGPELLGGWLAWLALGMLACLADLGLRESLVRRVAIAQGQGDTRRVHELIDTTVLTVAGSMALALALLMGVGPFLLGLGPAVAVEPATVLGIAVMVWAQRVADVHAAALEGLQRYELVARNNVLGAVAGVATLLLALPHLGLAAASLGLVVQYGTAGAGHLLALRQALPARRAWPRHWQARLAREGLAFGLSVQVAVGSFLLIESVTKLLLAQAGALALLSFYDLAFRVGRGLRNLLVAGNRVLVPRLAQGGTDNDVNALYLRSFHLLLFLSLPIFSLALAAAGLVSWATRGGEDTLLVIGFALVLPAWFSLCVVDPVINVAMGTGRMRPVVLAHAAMVLLMALAAVAMPALWQLLGRDATLGGLAVLVAATASIVIPCLGLLLVHHRGAQAPPWRAMRPARSVGVTAGAWALAGAVHALPPGPAVQAAACALAALLLLTLLRLLPAWETLRAAMRARRVSVSRE